MSMTDTVWIADYSEDPRAIESDRKIAELRAQVAKMREALEKIAKVRRGLDLTDTDEYRADYWSRLAQSYQNLARKALRDALSA